MTNNLSKFCRRCENEPLWMSQDGKIFMLRVTTQQRLSTAEDMLCNMCKMQCLGDTSHPNVFFNRALWSGHGGGEDSFTWTQQEGPPLPRLLLLAITVAKGLNANRKAPLWALHVVQFPRGTSQPPTSKLIVLHPFHHGRGNCTCALD